MSLILWLYVISLSKTEIENQGKKIRVNWPKSHVLPWGCCVSFPLGTLQRGAAVVLLLSHPMEKEVSSQAILSLLQLGSEVSWKGESEPCVLAPHPTFTHSSTKLPVPGCPEPATLPHPPKPKAGKHELDTRFSCHVPGQRGPAQSHSAALSLFSVLLRWEGSSGRSSHRFKESEDQTKGPGDIGKEQLQAWRRVQRWAQPTSLHEQLSFGPCQRKAEPDEYSESTISSASELVP